MIDLLIAHTAIAIDTGLPLAGIIAANVVALAGLHGNAFHSGIGIRSHHAHTQHAGINRFGHLGHCFRFVLIRLVQLGRLFGEIQHRLARGKEQAVADATGHVFHGSIGLADILLKAHRAFTVRFNHLHFRRIIDAIGCLNSGCQQGFRMMLRQCIVADAGNQCQCTKDGDAFGHTIGFHGLYPPAEDNGLHRLIGRVRRASSQLNRQSGHQWRTDQFKIPAHRDSCTGGQ